MRGADKAMGNHSKAPQPESPQAIYHALARILQDTAVAMAERRRGRKRVDQGRTLTPAELATRLVSFARALENEDRTVLITTGQFMRYGGEEWTHAFKVKVGMLASKLYEDIHGVRPKRSRQDPISRNKVAVFPRGIIQQAYWSAVDEIQAAHGDGAVWHSITGGVLEKAADMASRKESKASGKLRYASERRRDAEDRLAWAEAMASVGLPPDAGPQEVRAAGVAEIAKAIRQKRNEEMLAKSMRQGFVTQDEDYARTCENEYEQNIGAIEETPSAG